MSIIIACEWGASCTRNRFALAWHMPLPNGALREQMWKNNGTLSSTTSSGRLRCVRPAAHRAKQRADDICAVENWLIFISTHHSVCKVLFAGRVWGDTGYPLGAGTRPPHMLFCAAPAAAGCPLGAAAGAAQRMSLRAALPLALSTLQPPCTNREWPDTTALMRRVWKHRRHVIDLAHLCRVCSARG
jgi:hypothetical protein